MGRPGERRGPDAAVHDIEVFWDPGLAARAEELRCQHERTLAQSAGAVIGRGTPRADEVDAPGDRSQRR
jgi:hypothetical protein